MSVMETETIYRWILEYGHYAAQGCLVITAALMVKSRKKALEWTVLVGFTAFLAGTLMMYLAQGTVVHLGQFSFGSRSDRQLWQIGRAVSTFGFLAGAAARMLSKVFRR